MLQIFHFSARVYLIEDTPYAINYHSGNTYIHTTVHKKIMPACVVFFSFKLPTSTSRGCVWSQYVRIYLKQTEAGWLAGPPLLNLKLHRVQISQIWRRAALSK